MWLEVILIGGVGYLLYQLLKPAKDFWEEYGVPQLHIASYSDKLQLFLGKRTIADNDQLVYKALGSGKFCGIVELQKPILLVKDLEMVKKVLIKDFDYFVDRRAFLVGSKKQEVMNKMLVNLSGDEWKGVRASLSPTFTTGKIRRMMEHFNNVSQEWRDHLKEEIKKAPQQKLSINVQQETNNFAVDTIAATVFGMSARTIKDPKSTLAEMVRRLTAFSLLAAIKFGLGIFFPGIIKLFGINTVDVEALSFFQNILSQGVKSRMEGKVKQNDFMQILVEARKGELKAEGTDELDDFEKEAELSKVGKKNYLADDDITSAQALQFFFAGFSTTSNFLGFALYMLALHPEVQDKLRDEVNSQLFSKKGEEDQNIDYDDLNKLVYLDMFMCEVHRKFPALGRIERVCVKDYHDPSENLRVPKDAMVGIPIQSIHNDKRYYEHPDKFYPEHFTPEKKANRSPYAFLPFGSGPRNCIGMRFAVIESKAAIAHLVHNFKIEPTEKTPIPYKTQSIGIGETIRNDLELGLSLAN